MARAINGVEVGGSLAKLAEGYGLGKKGTEIVNALGKRRLDFTSFELSKYGDYCINDVELTYKLFRLLMKVFPKQELKIIDLTLRMFINPELELDVPRLMLHLTELQAQKAELLAVAGVDKKDLMSNPKFAELLVSMGVTPPTKISTRTGKTAYAFARTDEGFAKLANHPDHQVQALHAARVGNKSTLEETRTQRFIDIGARGTLPVPIKYYAAHTGRWGGMDKINLQNLPSRGKDAKVLKSCITAPKGYRIIEADSAQIEARVLAWLSGQNDLVEEFAEGRDVYKRMAATIYDTDVENVTGSQRFVGKQTILGSGYGMGANRFQAQLKTMDVEVELDEARRIINIYREVNPRIVHLWDQGNQVLKGMTLGADYELGKPGVLRVLGERNAIKLPSGLLMRYQKLEVEPGERGPQYSYWTRRGRTKIYGGKVTENCCQALARCIIGEQMLRISKRYRVLLTVHDSIACCVPKQQVDNAVEYIAECMRFVPEWAKGLPLDCDVAVGKNYGETEEIKV